MEEFVANIKEKYRNRLICNHDEKQWPPCYSKKLVRLELVVREKGEGYSANYSCLQRGNEEQYDHFEFFKAKSKKKPVRRVLVEGSGGIGKTTLCISVSEDWANGKLFQQFELLLLLPLCEEK